MEKIKGLAIELDMDHLSVDRGLKGLKDNIRSVNSEMRKNMSAFDYGERSVKKYQTSLTGLNKKLDVQKVAVAEAKKEYEDMVKQYGRGSVEAERAAREYNNQSASLNNLERYIERTKNELAAFEKEQRIANSSWTKLGNKLEVASDGFRKVSEVTGSVGSALTNKITKPALIAVTAVGGITAALGWKRLVGLDTAKAQLKGLGYEGKDVDRIMEQVTRAIDGGMTTAAEGTAIAAGALAAGVKEGKELERYIKLVGDAAVGANRPVGEMAQIFNRVQGQGKLMTQELNMIEQSMPGFAQAMADSLANGSLESFRKMVTNGEVGSKDFLKVMDSFAGNMASAYSESWEGMVKNTLAYVGIIGENILRGVFQKSKEEIADFIEVLKSDEVVEWAEKAGVAIGNSFSDIIDKVRSLKSRYDELTPAQQEFVNKVLLIAPAVAIGIGPALTLFSKLTLGISSTLSIASRLTKAIGVAQGAGLVASLGGLGPLAIGGVAVAGLAAVGIAAYKLKQNSEELEEVNLDVAQSLTDEALALDSAANTFDKLSEKAKISNAELAELNDLNIRISESSNPGEIEELQKQYDNLAKKSGLSKDELERLFTANGTIIEQSPNVQKSISDQGNAFVESTEKVQEYISSLLEASKVELEAEREKQLARQNELTDELIDKERQLNDMQEALSYADELRTKNREELLDLDAQLTEQMNEAKMGSEEWLALDEKRTALSEAMNGNAEEYYFKLAENIKEQRKSVDLTKEELTELEEKTQALADIYLQQVGITEQGEKGLAALDKSIAKNEDELAKLDEKLAKNGELTAKEQERYDELSSTTEKQREHRDIIHDELGLYKDLNSLAQSKMEKADAETQKKIESLAKTAEIKDTEKNVVEQIQKKNSEIDKSISKLEQEREKQGANKKEIDKQISELEGKKNLNNAIIEQILKELGIWDQVKDSIESGTKKEREKGKAADGTKGKLDAQGNVIDKNNKKTDAGIGKEKDRSKEAGRGVDKKVDVWEVGIAAINSAASQSKSKKVSLWQVGLAAINSGASQGKSKKVNLFQSGLAAINRQASSPVSKVINFVGRGLSKLKFWEKGTPPSGHPGGPAVIGEKGSELVKLPSGKSFLSPSSHTLLDLPRGAHVIPHQETKRIVRNAPRYADGTSDWLGALGNSELASLFSAYNRTSDTNVFLRDGEKNNKENTYLKDLLQATLEQNQILMEILQKDNTAVIGFEEVYQPIKKRLSKDQYSKNKGKRRR